MSSDSDEQDQVFEAAASWWLKVRGDQDYDEYAFKQWLDAHPHHITAFEAVKAEWGLFDTHAAAPEVLVLRSQALNRAYRAAGQRWRAKTITRRTSVAVLAALIILPVTFRAIQGREKTYRTGIAEQRTFTLADGTTITLDANSYLKVRFTPRLRDVEIVSGLAHFDVASDARRPLIVKAGDRTVTAIGTAFSVELRYHEMSVVLAEGQVVVATPFIAQNLEPHQQLVISRQGDTELKTNIDLSQSLAWREGRLFFEDVPLERAVARMNDYALKPIRLEGGVERYRISGLFLTDRAESFIEAIADYYPVDIVHGTNSVTIKPRS